MNVPDNIKVGFIGAGKVGTALGRYFSRNGIRVIGYYSRSSASAKNAAELTGTQAFETIDGLLEKCEMVFITTPDDQIESVWNELIKHNIKDKIICHTSGSVTSAVFEGITELGAFGYSVHPMYAFSNRDGSYTGFEKAYFTIEGDKDRLAEITSIISELGNKTLVIDKADKALYHVANVMVSNFVLALISSGVECLAECGIHNEDAISALMPLIIGNIDNISRNGIQNALTGPVERNDINTIEKHIDALPTRYKGIYKDLMRLLVELAKKKHPKREYSEILKLLEDFES